MFLYQVLKEEYFYMKSAGVCTMKLVYHGTSPRFSNLTIILPLKGQTGHNNSVFNMLNLSGNKNKPDDSISCVIYKILSYILLNVLNCEILFLNIYDLLINLVLLHLLHLYNYKMNILIVSNEFMLSADFCLLLVCHLFILKCYFFITVLLFLSDPFICNVSTFYFCNIKLERQHTNYDNDLMC